LIWALLSWIIQLLTKTGWAPEIALTLLIAISAFTYQKNSFSFSKEWLQSELTGILIFSLSLLICSFHPEITWGERPMDSTFLRFFMRMPQLPPCDPWASEVPMRYYYFGSYVFGILSKLLRIPAGTAYPLGMASVWTLLGLNLVGLFRAFHLSIKHSFLGVLALLWTGNYALLWLQSTQNLQGFDLFWASTRILTSPTFSEFPLWTFLFYDLHSHYIAWIPESLLWVSLILLAREKKLLFAVLSGLAFGLIFYTNVWAWIATSLLLLFFLLLYPLPIRSWIAIGTTAFFTVVPFYLHLPKGTPIVLPYIHREPGNSLKQLLLFSGHWWILCFLLFRNKKTALGFTEIQARDGITLFLTFSICFLVLYLANIFHFNFHFGIFTMITLLGSVWTFHQTDPNSPSRMLWIFILSGIVLTLIAESVVWIDRMNTVFKWWLPAHFWLSLGVSGLFLRWGSSKKWALKLFLILLIPNFISGTQSIIIMTQHRFAPGPRPTLNGDAFLELISPDEAKAFQFLNQNTTAPDILIEATGGHYDGRARVAQFTGLPIVLGWEHHSRQRGVSEAQIQNRTQLVRKLYESTDPNEKRRIAQAFHARWIFVGHKEIKHYPGAGLQVFDQTPGFRLAFQSGPIRIYEVVSK
jgi:YYY domain-containing protein